MSRPRPRQALVCGAIIAAGVACALFAGGSRAAQAKTTVLHYAIPLPKPHRGKVVLLELRTQLPQNMTVGGTVAVATVTNLRRLPCYVRAAQVTRKNGRNLWHVFIAIAAPEGRVVCGHPSPPSPAKTLRLRVEIGPLLSNHALTVKKPPFDTCKLLKAELPHTLNGVALTGFDLGWKQIVLRTTAADPACR